ncbi:hypothetical protein [Pantoea rwandensis]|uniref:Uncharacterized protein n=1 Tax=Pantoea rwandensis TaxID=1076550 RepID=A0ABM5RP29_9GAMM|nr:hypothetical protein [Pantoea rwandensis]AIR87674.1 hypothetical protein LH22_20210 [Pantoea rwandensis]
MASSKTHDLDIYFNDHKFSLTSDILSACIGYGSKIKKYEFITGFCEKKSNGYAILLRLISMTFDVREISIDDDRIYARYSNEVDAFIASLSKTQLNEIVGELADIYRHLQGVLNTAGVSHINLRREIRPRVLLKNKINEVRISSYFAERMNYSSLLMLYEAAANLLGKEKIPVRMDILNSFSDTNQKGGYGDISLELSIPVENILYSHLSFPSDKMEGDEWVIMNRYSAGIVEIPVSSIVISNAKIRDYIDESYKHLTLHSAQQLFSMDYSTTWGRLSVFNSF